MRPVEEYENPSRPEKLVMAVIFTAGFGMLMLIFPHILIIGLCSFFIVDTWAATWIREYYLRAIKIGVDRDGLVLSFRYSEPRRVEWTSIASISLRTKHNKPVETPEPGAFGELKLSLTQKLPRRFPLRADVAVALRDAYVRAMGRPPENRPIL